MNSQPAFFCNCKHIYSFFFCSFKAITLYVNLISRVYCHSLPQPNALYLSDRNTIKRFFQFNPAAPFQPEDHVAFKPVTLQDKVHCVAYVLDAGKVSLLSCNVQQNLRAIRQKVNSLGMLHLTHIQPTKQ